MSETMRPIRRIETLAEIDGLCDAMPVKEEPGFQFMTGSRTNLKVAQEVVGRVAAWSLKNGLLLPSLNKRYEVHKTSNGHYDSQGPSLVVHKQRTRDEQLFSVPLEFSRRVVLLSLIPLQGTEKAAWNNKDIAEHPSTRMGYTDDTILTIFAGGSGDTSTGLSVTGTYHQFGDLQRPGDSCQYVRTGYERGAPLYTGTPEELMAKYARDCAVMFQVV
jgi:hypothetical protein